MKKVHFIAIGGSVMHSLAIAFKKMGYVVTGSDDEIFEPSKSKLNQNGILPDKEGWDEHRITSDLDAVILGMHAKKDNPELVKAQQMGIKIYSFPEYIYQASKNKQRVVIAGSHGKTTITAMIMHVLSHFNRKFDYMVGSSLEGFENQVQITEDAPTIIIEGDEYMTSPLDLTPKFLHYHHHIAVISGIAWDHINVYPNREEYNLQFERLIDLTDRSGKVIFNEDDLLLSSICHKDMQDVAFMPYTKHKATIKNGKTILKTKNGDVLIEIFGEHNLYNLSAAKEVCNRLGILDDMFYDAIKSFKGAAKRLEKVRESANSVIYKDFAHAPSKLEATVNAMKEQFPDRKLTACIELHTFSSLNKEFLSEYEGTLDKADQAIVFVNPHALEHKKLPSISEEEIRSAFKNKQIHYITNSQELKNILKNQQWENHNLLMMSSGNFGGININEFAKEL